MFLTFRWFGQKDLVTLAHIRQVPGVEGIVSALHDMPPGEVWPQGCLARLRDQIESAGFRFSVVESIPVHEDIKLGRPTRDRLIENYCRSIRHVGETGVPVVCYNFMPVFDWVRTDLAMQLPDGSLTMAYDHDVLERMDLSQGIGKQTAWANAYDGVQLAAMLAAWRDVSEERLWENLAYFLERVAPVAAEAGVKLGLHPDDPPWPVFGVPRIITTGPALERVLTLCASPANGITFCTGSLGVRPENDLPAIISRLEGRIYFAHCRNVRRTGPRQFHEVAHPSRFGDVDMQRALRALRAAGFDGPMRSDHGRMIWEETGQPGYGLHDRALGAMYLQGMWEAGNGERSTVNGQR